MRKKLVTYPRTDARVLSTAVAKEIYKNIEDLVIFSGGSICSRDSGKRVLERDRKSRYTNDKQITDHYAIIRPGRDLVLFAVYQWLDSKYMR